MTLTSEAPRPTALPLTGRRALVTGGSRGIGAGIVRRLVADGAAVAFTYNSSPEAAEKLVAELSADGSTVLALQADSGDVDAVRTAVARRHGIRRSSRRRRTRWSGTCSRGGVSVRPPPRTPADKRRL